MIAAYLVLVLSIQQVCHGAIGHTVKKLDMDELGNSFYEIDDDSETWLEKCEKLTASSHEVFHLAKNTTEWLHTITVELVKDMNNLRKCSGLFKSICIAQGTVKLMNDLRSIPEEIKSRFNLTDELAKQVMSELVVCLLNLEKDRPDKDS